MEGFSKQLQKNKKPFFMTKIIILLSFVFLFLSNFVFPQSIKTSNVHHSISDDKIEIFYDLPINSDSISVTVAFYKKPGATIYTQNILVEMLGKEYFLALIKK